MSQAHLNTIRILWLKHILILIRIYRCIVVDLCVLLWLCEAVFRPIIDSLYTKTVSVHELIRESWLEANVLCHCFILYMYIIRNCPWYVIFFSILTTPFKVMLQLTLSESLWAGCQASARSSFRSPEWNWVLARKPSADLSSLNYTDLACCPWSKVWIRI